MSSALAAWNFSSWPALTFVGFENIRERGQFGLLRAVLGAAHQLIGPLDQQGVRRISHGRKARHRLGGIVAAFVGGRLAA